MTTWKKASFEIAAYMRGKETVTGIVLGHFGIDKRGGRVWKVTHLPSGNAVALLTGVKLAECKAYVEHVQHLNWTATDPQRIAADNGMGPRELVDYLRTVKGAVADAIRSAAA